ncbi:pirin family protein [Sphaerisporangium fuscum]|uniref:pirin family protein n=1 Tax=Sphaerisporangium fuscum TaxID=2835868 RepID=UPI001BDD63C1|nr:pirin family protein [Sphaerisporangium fuscum]
MSNLERDPQATLCGAEADADGPARELLTGREVVLGGPRGMKVTRTLPGRGRRMVGAWCFADNYGPEPATMRVPPHPHTGLQTVSWLLEGEVLHRDSLGSEQMVRPGQLNLMTAGRAISHSEESAPDVLLHGVQLWVALPDSARDTAPSFEHHPVLPVLSLPGVAVTVFVGELGGLRSPATVHTPLVGAEAALTAGARAELPLRPGFEYAVMVLSGAVEVNADRPVNPDATADADGAAEPNGAPEGGSASDADGVLLEPGPLLYLGCGRSALTLRAREASRLLLLGGEPFEEEIVMWWNFVGRSHEEIVRFRKEWSEGSAFGTVEGFDGPPLPAPALPTTHLKPRGRHR